MSNTIVLYGCAPDPLIHYMKALGVLRIVAEQLDPLVRGAWHGDALVVEANVTKEELTDFFFAKYQPTPIISPWNNGSGFHSGEGYGIKAVTLPRMKGTNAKRLELYRVVIRQAEELLAPCLTPEILALKPEKRSEALKPILIPLYRSNLPDEAIVWLDAVCVVTDSNNVLPAPLLGSVGNDGNLEFSLNFMDRLLSVLPEIIGQKSQEKYLEKEAEEKNKANKDNRTINQAALEKHKSFYEKQRTELCEVSKQQLNSALFRDEPASLIGVAVGQFHPAGAGGANATQDVKGESFVNPWDFVFAIEGTLLLANAAVRRLAVGARTKASFPFTVENSFIGYGTATSDEKVRAEIWLPLWSRMTSYAEIAHIFKEGRVRFSGQRKSIRTGFDFARAVAELGADRGIESFQRYAFIERNGQANLAAPLGCFEVRERPSAGLIHDFDRWLDLMSGTVTGEKTPPRLARAQQRVEDAIFRLCESGSADHLREVLIALGAAETELAKGQKFRESKDFLHPLSGLRLKWATKCDDGSDEFKLAATIASIRGGDGIDSIRENIEPVTVSAKGIDWKNNSARTVWGAGKLEDNLTDVLLRRSIDARAQSLSHPVLTSMRYAPLKAINAFLSYETDDARIEELLRGLILLDWPKAKQDFEPISQHRDIPSTLPRAYALLKLLFLPEGRFKRDEKSEAIIIKHEPSILPLLQARRVSDALRIAYQRLQTSGLTPASKEFHFDDAEGARLAAALLIPIDEPSIRALAALVLRDKTEDQ